MLDYQGNSSLSWKQWMSFYLGAKTKFNSQSALFFQFYDAFIKDQLSNHEDQLEMLEAVRTSFLNSKRKVKRTDLGAGESTGLTQSVRQIILRQAASKQRGRLLHRLSQSFEKARILELGTSVGISSAYMSVGHPSARIDTIEGDPVIAELAHELHDELGLKNIEIFQSSIQDYFTQHHAKKQWDIVYMDGDHTFPSTLAYYKEIKSSLHSNSIVLLDDVMWSRGMLKAWTHIRKSGSCTASLQWGNLGILFYHSGFVHHIHEDWIPWHWKPHTKFLSW